MLSKMEEDIINVAMTYKRTLCKLVRTGKESNLLQLLKDESTSEHATLTIADYAKENLDMDHRFIINVHLCLSLLDGQEKEIIWNEYFLKQGKPGGDNWWTYHYARSTYYRIRNKAIKEFHALCCK